MPQSTRDITQELEAQAVRSALDVGQWTLHGRRSRCFVMTSGSGSILVGSEDVALRAPCLVWLPEGQSAHLTMQAGSSGAWLAVTGQALGHVALPGSIADDLRHMLLRPQLGTTLKPDVARGLTDHLLAIEGELRASKPGAPEMVRHLLAAVFIGLWRMSELVSHEARPLPRFIVDHFLQLVEVHLHDQWKVADYAAAMGVSTDRLNTAVRRALGKAPLEVIHDRVCAAARQMLESSGLQIDRVAALLGFDDPAYFSRFFKRLTGMSPRQYRHDYASRAARPAGSFAAWP
jgi:AraC family transcriptional regulator, transcriptional activator of pobA